MMQDISIIAREVVGIACSLLVTVSVLAGTCVAGAGEAPDQQDMPGGLLLITSTPGGSSGGDVPAEADSLSPPEYYQAKWSPFWRTTIEMLGFNLIMTMYGKYIMKPEDHGFDVGFDSIRQNLKNGFEWDDNSFSANNFRHPYQGSLYFGAARANGYDFYESSMFAFAGSWLFEYAGEAHHPSINDWINTAVGGITIGESLYRLSDMILDNTATGSGRVGRELGGLACSPLRGVNRLLTGEAFEVHANPPNRFPGYFGANLEFGFRTLGEEELWTSSSSKAFFSFDILYGNPFEVTRGRPFDHYTFGMQVNFRNSPHGIGRMESKGLIYAGDVNETETSHHIFGSFLHFDYIDNEAYTYGGQSLSASYLSHFRASDRFAAYTLLHLQCIMLGAAKSDYFSLSGREYDYGPGVGYKLGAQFWLENWEFLSLWHEGYWIHSVNGNKADHYVNLSRAKLDYPLRGFLGLGAEYILYIAERNYEEYPDVFARNPELRLYLIWKTD
jgi:hypothetical protein